MRNLRGSFYDLGRRADAKTLVPQLPKEQAWATLTGQLLGR